MPTLGTLAPCSLGHEVDVPAGLSVFLDLTVESKYERKGKVRVVPELMQPKGNPALRCLETLVEQTRHETG